MHVIEAVPVETITGWVFQVEDAGAYEKVTTKRDAGRHRCKRLRRLIPSRSFRTPRHAAK